MHPVVFLADSIITSHFILEDSDAVPVRDSELLLDECVLQP